MTGAGSSKSLLEQGASRIGGPKNAARGGERAGGDAGFEGDGLAHGARQADEEETGAGRATRQDLCGRLRLGRNRCGLGELGERLGSGGFGELHAKIDQPLADTQMTLCALGGLGVRAAGGDGVHGLAAFVVVRVFITEA